MAKKAYLYFFPPVLWLKEKEKAKRTPVVARLPNSFVSDLKGVGVEASGAGAQHKPAEWLVKKPRDFRTGFSQESLWDSSLARVSSDVNSTGLTPK